jgi:glycerol-3-phosphate dehydrogenase
MQRRHTLEALQNSPDKLWDIIIIGGGATGLGAGVDAAARGLQTLVLEQYDFAKGTSSRSTKLVHGGVRYLAQGNFPLVMESLRERGLLRQNAPHLVKDLRFIIPLYHWWSGFYYGAGLKLYDLLAGKLNLGPSQHISKTATLQALPNLLAKNLKGGVCYHDGQFDDARLAVNLAQTVTDQGGYVVNYCPVTGLHKNADGKISGVTFLDVETNNSYDVNAKVVVNATGVFVDGVRGMDQPAAEKMVVLSQGVHVVLDKSFLSSDSAILIPKTTDGRILFLLPWYGRVLAGTTDTPCLEPEIEPIALKEEIDFILETAAVYLCKAPTRSDILSVFAGLRPLVVPKRNSSVTKGISRSHKLFVSPSGLLTVVGGKWTTYRKMGEDIIDKALKLAGLSAIPCNTQHLPIHGFVENQREGHLAIYGADASAIEDLIAQHPELAEPLHPEYPYLKAEVVWVVREEMAITVEDILARRLRMLFLDARASIEMAPAIAALMAAELGHDQEWEKQQIQHYKEIAGNYLSGCDPDSAEYSP